MSHPHCTHLCLNPFIFDPFFLFIYEVTTTSGTLGIASNISTHFIISIKVFSTTGVCPGREYQKSLDSLNYSCVMQKSTEV